MSMIKRAEAHLNYAINFANSDLRAFIEHLTTQDISYFTEAKIAEINEFLGKSGWKLIGKNPTYYFKHGVLTYCVGKVFDIDEDIKCLQAEYEHAIEQEKEYQELIKISRKFWAKEVSKFSRDDLIELLVELDMRNYE